MISFAQFADRMRRAAAQVPAAIDGALHVTMDSVSREAKGYIGHELPQWAPLSEATMQGFRHPYGFWVKGKIELGYAGHMSSTDPLLRTGATRASIEPVVDGYTGAVASKSKVMLFQEMGTHNPLTGDIPPRPVLALAMSRARPQADLFFGRAAMLLLTTGGPRP